MISEQVSDYLHRAGIIMEKARRESRSLSATERNIIWSARVLAVEKGASKEQINAMEMAGERDWNQVLKPFHVEVVFAYYWDPVADINQPATADYFVKRSNHPAFPQGGNVMADELIKYGVKVPKTPSYDEWVKKGRKAVRS